MKKYYLATIISILYVTVVTIVGELYAPLKDALKNIFWHHWLGKGVVLIILYIVLVLAFSKTREKETSDSAYISAVIVLASVSFAAILGFFAFEFLKA